MTETSEAPCKALNISAGSAFLLDGWKRAERKYYNQFMGSDEFSGIFQWGRSYEAVKRISGVSLRCSDEENEKMLKKFSSQNTKIDHK